MRTYRQSATGLLAMLLCAALPSCSDEDNENFIAYTQQAGNSTSGTGIIQDLTRGKPVERRYGFVGIAMSPEVLGTALPLIVKYFCIREWDRSLIYND